MQDILANSLRSSLNPKFVKFSSTQITWPSRSRIFHVAKFSCSTVLFTLKRGAMTGRTYFQKRLRAYVLYMSLYLCGQSSEITWQLLWHQWCEGAWGWRYNPWPWVNLYQTWSPTDPATQQKTYKYKNIPVDNFGTVVGENPTPYGILALWAVNSLSIVYWDSTLFMWAILWSLDV